MAGIINIAIMPMFVQEKVDCTCTYMHKHKCKHIHVIIVYNNIMIIFIATMLVHFQHDFTGILFVLSSYNKANRLCIIII